MSSRDYSRSDYGPSDPNQVVYNWRTGTFTYKPRSQINSDYTEAIPRLAKELYLTPHWITGSKMVVLPGRVRAGRLVGNYAVLYVEKGE